MPARHRPTNLEGSESVDIERWDVFEFRANGPRDGNPFTEVTFGAVFSQGHRRIEVDGFYDGDGQYIARLMPDTEGEWTYVTTSDAAALDGQSGSFTCTPATGDNRGPVRVHDRFHFAYEDGTPHHSFGTTCYVWNHQGEALEAQTLETLAGAPFNKMRMCVFPKHYAYNLNEPELHPFEGDAAGGFDFTRFNPAFWSHLEQRIRDLRALQIEADLILFHPYDRWGYADMGAEADDRYLRYTVARLAAFRNVWWSFANEFDLMKAKAEADWDRYFRIVQARDPYQHLRGIHNCRAFYDHGKPWVTHCSVQRSETGQAKAWRAQYGKPVVVDECCYEGDVSQGWGNITAEKMVQRFWEGVTAGGYVGHGETYLHPEDILWWSKGGVLHGDSPPRIQFLRDIVEAGPPGLDPQEIGSIRMAAGVAGEYYLAYTGDTQSTQANLKLPDGAAFTVEVIDTWAMTVSPTDGTFSGECTVDLPGKPYIALRVRAAV